MIFGDWSLKYLIRKGDGGKKRYSILVYFISDNFCKQRKGVRKMPGYGKEDAAKDTDTMKKNKTLKNPICAVLWQDASYTFEKIMPLKTPLPRLTVGFIVSTNKYFTHIATNIEYDEMKEIIYPIDGFLIPEKTIIKFKKIGYFKNNEK